MISRKEPLMPTIAFEADTSAELVEKALRWALETLEASRRASKPGPLPPGDPALADVIGLIHGELARRFLRDVAERSLHGQSLSLIEAADRYRRSADPSAFVGIVGAVNRPMRRLGGRQLVRWEAADRSYVMDQADASVVIAALPPR
jgi:hypothetical protein